MGNIMVCVTKQKTCQRLIDYGKSLQHAGDEQIFVIHIAPENENFLNNSQEGEALEFLYEKAKDAGAQLTVERSQDAIGTLAKLAEKNCADRVVVGEAPEGQREGSFLEKLAARLGRGVSLEVVPAMRI